jgi:predicted nucleotidyltransferase
MVRPTSRFTLYRITLFAPVRRIAGMLETTRMPEASLSPYISLTTTCFVVNLDVICHRRYLNQVASTDKSLDILLDALKAYHPQKVILFGSVARGEADTESDLDVIVIKDTPDSFVERLEAMAKLCPLGIHADILVYTPQEIHAMIEEENPFITQALREGKLVYEAKP